MYTYSESVPIRGYSKLALTLSCRIHDGPVWKVLARYGAGVFVCVWSPRFVAVGMANHRLKIDTQLRFCFTVSASCLRKPVLVGVYGLRDVLLT